jgi:hypothetical protein
MPSGVGDNEDTGLYPPAALTFADSWYRHRVVWLKVDNIESDHKGAHAGPTRLIGARENIVDGSGMQYH